MGGPDGYHESLRSQSLPVVAPITGPATAMAVPVSGTRSMKTMRSTMDREIRMRGTITTEL